jgi:replication factor C small subunit
MKNSLWVEKYRPATVDDYVFKNEKLKQQVSTWIQTQTLPNLMLVGPAGTGKTSLVKILLTALNVQDTDIMYANGNKECRKIEWIDKLINFCQTMPFGDYKVVFIDEFENAGQTTVMPAMKNLMESYSNSVRFIATCNHPNRILPELHSRFQSIQIEKSDVIDYTSRIATILVEENIEFDLDTLDTYVKSAYPDLRKCINNVQLNSSSGKLLLPESSESTADYRLAMVELFKIGKISEARKLICSQAQAEEYVEIYQWLYSNLDLFSTDESIQDKIILAIKQGLVDHTICADPEINFAATMIKIAHLLK